MTFSPDDRRLLKEAKKMEKQHVQLFEAGDRVKFGEVEGVLEEYIYPQGVRTLALFDKTRLLFTRFTTEGELFGYHTFGRALTLIEKAKKKISLTAYINIYENYVSLSNEQKSLDGFRLACVPFVFDSENEHIQISKKDLEEAVSKAPAILEGACVEEEKIVEALWRVLKEGKQSPSNDG